MVRVVAKSRLPSWASVSIAVLTGTVLFYLAAVPLTLGLGKCWALLFGPSSSMAPDYVAWAVALACAFLAARWLRDRLRWKLVKYDDAQCLHCGYDLTGNVSGVCPECGEQT
jgi:hypothetical protein